MLAVATLVSVGLVAAPPVTPAQAAITWTPSATMPDQPIAVNDLASGILQLHYTSDGIGINLHFEQLFLPCGTIYSSAWGMNQYPASARSMASIAADKLLFLSGDPSGSTADTRIAYVSYDPADYPQGNSCTGAPSSANVTGGATYAHYIDNPIQSGSTRYSGMGRMVYDAANNRMYVANGANDRVFVLDTTTMTWVTSVVVGDAPWDLALDSTRGQVFVTNRLSNDVSVISTATNTVTATIAVGSTPRGIDVNATTGKVYVANSGAATITEINGVTLAVANTISTTGNPLDLAVDSTSSYVYYMATNGNIGVIDLADSNRNQVAGEGPYAPLLFNNALMNPTDNTFHALVRNGQDTGMGSFPYASQVIFKPTIRSAAPANAVRATSPGYAAYSHQMTATGTSPILWTKQSGNLPPGLSVSSAGLISGTPTDYSDGSYTFVIRAYNQNYTYVYSEATYTIVVPPHPPTITTTTLPSATAGVAYSATINTTFHPTVSLRNGDSLPAGLTLTSNSNNTATISGTPTTGGTTNFRLEATNGVAPDAYRDLSITVTVSPPVIDPASISGCTFSEGESQNWNFWSCVPYLASGSPSATFTISAGALPSGLTFNTANPGNERVYGTVNDVAGTAWSVTFRATNASTGLYDEETMSGTISPSAPGTTWGQTYYAFEGVPFALDPKPNPRGTSPITWSTNGNEPSWTTLNTSTGFLTGTPGAGTAGQSTVFELTAVNAATVSRGWPATDYPQIDVAAAPTQTQSLTVAAGATLAPTALSVSGSITTSCYRIPNGAVVPSWFTLDDCWNGNDTGSMGGSAPANAGGTYQFVIIYYDTSNYSQVGTLITLNVTVPAPVLTATTNLNLVAGAGYSATVANTGGAVSSWSLSGAPNGWAINSSGVLSGTVPTAGTYTFSVTATNSGGSSTSNYTLVSAAAPVIAPTISAGVFQTGAAMNYQILASGAQPITFTAVSGLPAWASLSSAGVITGTPPSAGSYSMVVSLTNAAGGPVQSTINFSSAVAPSMPATLSPPAPVVGVGYNYQVPAPTAGTGPFTYSIVGSLPAGLTLNTSTGVISGTPTTAGAASFSVVVTNGITSGTNSATSTVSVSTVVQAPVYSTTLSQYLLTSAAVNLTQSYVSGSPAASWVVANGSTLPAWLTLDGTTGALTGTAPGTAATVSFNLTGSNATGSVNVSVSITVQAVPSMAATATATAGSVGSSYNYTVTPSSGTGPFSFTITAGSLPAGVTLNPSTGVISGTPTTVGAASFTVSATNGVGSSSTAYSLGISPAVPTAPTVVVTGSGTATASITAVAGATSYALTSSPAGVSCTITAPATSCSLTGLANGTAYTFTATATGSSLTSPASTATTAVTSLAASGVPSVVAANGSATVTVATVTGATSYTLTAAPGGATCTVTAPATSCVISGLTNGTAYTFTQTATAGAYTTPASAASASVTPQIAPPATPSINTVVGGSGQATVTIGAVAGATSYVVTASPGGATCTVTAPATSCVVSGLTNGTAYTFSAVASNIAGASAASAASTAVSPLAVPGAPTTASTTSGSVTVTPGTVAGATSYVVTASNGGGSCTVTSPATTCVISGLTNGTAYTFTTVASSATATSTASVVSASFTSLAAPAAPNVATTTSGAVTITPGTVAGATSYVVTASNAGGSCTVTSPATTCVISGLTNGTAYTFSTVANGGSVSSSASAASASIAPLAAPTAVTATAGSSGATITIGGTSAGATSYLVTASGNGGTCTVLASANPLSCVMQGLNAGTAYTFSAVAQSVNAASGASIASAAVTPTLAAPGVPTVSGVSGNGSITANIVGAITTLSVGAPASYLVTASPGGATCTVTLPATSCLIASLNNGTVYTLTATATNATGTSAASTASAGITPAAPPAIPAPTGSLSLPAGQTAMPTIGGGIVTVNGSNLGGSTVLVGGVQVQATINSNGTSLTFVAPAHPVGNATVLVTLPGAAPLSLALTYATPAVITPPAGGNGTSGGNGSTATPVLQVVAPAAAAASQSIVINGTNLAGVTITVAGQSVTPIANAAGTQVSFLLPAGLAHGSHQVVIITAAGLRTTATLVFQAPASTTISLRVLFTSGSAQLTALATKAIRAFINKNIKKATAINLIGYVSAKPVLASDVALSKKRAMAVATLIKSMGVKLVIKANGAGRDTASSAQSRRVDVLLTTK